jgi:hypothetical protein
MFGRLARAAVSFATGMVVAVILKFVAPKYVAFATDGPLTEQSSIVTWFEQSVHWFPLGVFLSVVIMIVAGALTEAQIG